jgi:carboxypeptidase Q
LNLTRNLVGRNFSLLLVIAGAVACAAAQAAPPPNWSEQELSQLRQLQGAALEDEYTYKQLAHLADNIGARPSGSPQAAAAVEYVAQELRNLGLEVKLEKVSVPRWVRGEEKAELVSYPGQVPGVTQRIVFASLGAPGVATPPQGITADVVVVNTFDELAAVPREKVAGKIVLFDWHFDQGMEQSGFAGDAYAQAGKYRNQGRLAAEKQGAIAMLVRSVGGAEFRLPHTGATDFQHQAKIPAEAITAEDADLIARLSKQGPVRMHLLSTSTVLPDVDSYNVIADLKGSEHPEQIVIVSGHLDSWDLGTGAIDDGAGVALALETAHLLKQLQLHPKRTIRVVAWMTEELGLYGARAYGREHAAEMSNHFAGIETDSGAGHAMGFFITGDESIQKMMQPVADILQTSGAGIVRTSEDAAPDLSPLNVRGVPAFTPVQDVRKYFDYHHTAADTLDKVDPKELRENAAVVSVLTYALATMQRELPHKVLPIPDFMK